MLHFYAELPSFSCTVIFISESWANHTEPLV